jgi:hypothetical protein
MAINKRHGGKYLPARFEGQYTMASILCFNIFFKATGAQ